MSKQSQVYLNGEYLPKAEAKVSVDDRGFVLSDGVYEVTPAYWGQLFRLEHHLARLARNLREVRIGFEASALAEVHRRLLTENGLEDVQMSIVYLQITRGAAPRTHQFPDPAVTPTVYAFAKEFQRSSDEAWGRGFEAITVPDRRWARVDIKTIGLLPNVLAHQAAVEAGASDALLVKDGVALEGAHSNFFVVVDGAVVTHPTTSAVLPGITRAFVLELAQGLGYDAQERPIQIEEVWEADEAFFTGTTTEIRPTVKIDGEAIGEGRPGPVTRRLFDAFALRTSRAGAPAGRA